MKNIVKQVVESTEQAMSRYHPMMQLAEHVNKLRKKQFNFNNTNLAVLIAGIVFIIVMGLFSYFIVAATNNNADAIKDTITESVGTQNAAIMGLAETIENGDADIIAGIDGVQN
jgi:heme/copper-type cytochrome/quinol oxidase subunit 2